MSDSATKSEKKRKKRNSVMKSEKKRKKRKLTSHEDEPIVVELDLKLEETGPWRNLKLILSLRNKKIDIQKKVELAFSYVNSRVKGGSSDANEECETVKTSRLIVFLSDWVQSLLISTEKEVKVDGGGNQCQVIEAYLDFRCWVIFKFCLEESLKWHVYLSFSQNLLRAISCIAKHVSSLLDDKSLCFQESFFVGEGFELYGIVLDCLSLIFSSQGGLSKENLKLWVSTVDSVLELALKIYFQDLDGGKAGAFVLQFSCLVLEPFVKFLRVHATQKDGYEDFADKLLEPLLHLLGILQFRVDSDSGRQRNLLKLTEEVLSHGLFHPSNFDVFLGLRSSEKYLASHDGKKEDSKREDIRSYHRHLFRNLKNVITAKKVSVSSGIGQLFHLLVNQVKKQKGAAVLPEGTKLTGKIGPSKQMEFFLSGHISRDSLGSSSSLPEHSYSSSNLNAETRKSLFDFFVKIMEPLLVEMNGYAQGKLVEEPVLLGAHCTLKSINSLLASLKLEKIYVRTEDVSEGACLNFLRKVYDAMMSFASNLPWLSKCDRDNGTQKELFTCLAKELLVCVGYFLDIEYEVIGHDLVSLWLMMLSYLGIGISLLDEPGQRLLTSQILDLGCQLVNLYSELRQVDITIFSLCKAVRLAISCDGDGESSYTRFLSCVNSLPRKAYAKSVGMVLCSQEFKLSIRNAIRSIPEGQASRCIRQLTVDISESMKWMKGSATVTDGKKFNKLKIGDYGALGFDLQAEILGKGLSELYALVLDSLTATTGNSNHLGISIKELLTIICPCISSLVQRQPDTVSEFLFAATGRTSENGVDEKKNVIKYELPTQWVFVFFFRLYMSCRSLYRQSVSLMPPDTSKKMSTAMGDFFTAYSGRDWMEKTDWTDEGYFSWIVQPSASLLEVIQFVSDTYLKDKVADCCPLIYVLHAMTLQRLVDLNRQIMSLEYLLQSNDNAIQFMLLNDIDLSRYRKKCKKLKRRVSSMNQEAAGLTDFMMGYVSLVTDDQLANSSFDDAPCEDKCAQEMHGGNEWNLGVGAVDEKSLPTAIWWIVSQNIDIWCTHAASKKLKMFLSLLIRTSLPHVKHRVFGAGEHNVNEADCFKKVIVHHISYELLSDCVLYEHQFVRRHLASRFCRILEKSAIPLFGDFHIGDVDFSSSPDWTLVLSAFENSSTAVSGNKHVTGDSFSEANSISHSCDKLPTVICKEQKTFQFASMNFSACQDLLNLICWMPKGYLNSRSFTLFATYILNLERILVGILLQCRGALSSHNHYEFFRLFVSCRRTLKYIIVASCEDRTKVSRSSHISILTEGSDLVLWLFKSVFLVVGLQEALSDDLSSETRDMIFSLMDHTSYIFLTVSKYHFNCAIHPFLYSGKPCKEQLGSGVARDENNLKESDPFLASSKDVEASKNIFLVTESLKEHAQNLLMSLKVALSDGKEGVCVNVVNLNRLSSVFSCFSGILWGLASALSHSDAKNSEKSKLLRWKCEPVSKLNPFINVFADFISSFVHILVVEDDQPSGSSPDAQDLQKLDYCSDPLDGCDAESECSFGKQHQNSEAERTSSAAFDIDADPKMPGVHNCRSQLEDAKCPASALSNLVELQHLNRHILRGLLRGDHPEAAFLLRQLLIASSASLRLNLQISSTPFLSSLVPTFIGISQILLLELADMVEVPPPFTFVWLDGVLRYLEELGSHFPLSNPTLTRNVYAKLIELHLRAIGKCVSLQGKKATLASHETESSTKMLNGNLGFSEASSSHGPYCLEEFKARLRMSFKVFINKSSDLHLLSAVQAIERALVGVQEGCTMIYEVNTGSEGGGNVSSTVAAGIDCLDLVLEHASGRKRLNVVKRHIQNLIAALVNIIVHLQSPLVFYTKPISTEGEKKPDPGSVILMCIEVLTRVAGKHALFQMDSWHVAQSLRIPAAVFQDIRQLSLLQAPVPSNSVMFLDNQNIDSLTSLNSGAVDRQFSINLYAACCRLLYTILKHHKRECEPCIPLLEESVRVLLHCLETADTNVVRKGYFSWEVQDGVKCACFLRRIYEEVRQQKDVFGRHCFKFLSSYIWIYSGYGPLKTGIRREIDEALKPGVYALIDACSAEDLQYLHTVFGEGPCRNTLATLQHDYKLNFRYEGKV